MIDIGKDLKQAYEDGYQDRDKEIVRCKDCKYRKNRKGRIYYCALDTGDPFSLGRCAYIDNWFCADGERCE